MITAITIGIYVAAMFALISFILMCDCEYEAENSYKKIKVEKTRGKRRT